MANEVARPMRLAFVTPRYGPGVVGGSEAVMAEAARGLAARGHEVELLTTCREEPLLLGERVPDRHLRGARAHDPALQDGDGALRLVAAELERRVQRGDVLSPAEEIAWVNGRFRVPDLYLHLMAYARGFDAIVLSPYLFWSTIYGAEVAPERTIVMPCLHDEPYARLGIVSSTLSSVAGVWFLSEPEHQLGHQVAPSLPPHHTVVGATVERPERYDPAGFRARHGLERPFVLYAGRREDGKGWRSLLAGFGSAIVRHELPFDLVTVGVGSTEVPEGLRERVVDLGYLASEEVPNTFAAAEALVQPSTNESFSRTVMEAWLAGTPVVASEQGQVVTWHCERSGGGLTYADELELGECLAFVAEAPKAAAALAERGREYVLANYTWDVVLDAMERSLNAFARSGRP